MYVHHLFLLSFLLGKGGGKGRGGKGREGRREGGREKGEGIEKVE